MKNILLLSLKSLFLIINVQPIYSTTPDCEVIKYIKYCEVKNNKLFQTDTLIIQINNRTGEKYTDIEIPYSKNSKVSNIEGWIEDISGNVVRTLKRNEITDKSNISEISMFEDNYVKTFQLKHNSYPYRIFYTFKTTESQFTEIVSWTPVIHPEVSTKDARLYIILPKTYPFQKYIRNAACLTTDTFGDCIRLAYSAKFDKIEIDEKYAEPVLDFLPLVIIEPTHFYYGIEGSFENWKSYGNWFYKLNFGLTDLPADEKNTISQLINGLTDKKEIIKVLYHYMQDHTRYINVSIGIGGNKSYPASYVSENKYGDCKALSNYMKALLEYAGIKSNFTLINGGDNQSKQLIEELPNPYFNHVILAVPMDNDTIWLDNTDNTGPLGYVGTFIQNRKALFIEENSSRLIQMPVLKQKDVINNNNIKISFTNDGNAQAQVLFTFRGNNFEGFKQFNSDYNKDEQDRKIGEIMHFTNYEVIEWNLNKFNRDTAKIELKSKLTLYKFLNSLGTDFYFSIFPSTIEVFEPPKNRTLPVFIPYPICNVDSLIYYIPKDFEVKTYPADTKIITQYGSYEICSGMNNNVLKIIKKYELYPAKYKLEQYQDFYHFLNSIKILEKQKIILKKTIMP